MNRFALGMVSGCIGLLGMVAAGYALLAAAMPESLPAPTITRLAALDEKLRYLRRHPQLDPRILAVGSSIAWRQLDGAAFDEIAGGGRAFLNGGTAMLQIHQSRAMLDFYLSQYRNVRQVLLLTGPPDFDDCSRAPADLMPAKDAAAYAFGELPEAYFYMRYFAPQRFLKSAAALEQRQQPLTGDLYLDRWGSGPLHVPEDMLRGLRYGPSSPDPACLDALTGIVDDMRTRNIRLTIVFPPVHPAYREEYPHVMATVCAITRSLESTLAGDGVRVLNYENDSSYRPEDFFDAFHLQWPAVQRFSREIAQGMQDTPPSDALVASSRKPGLRDVQPQRERQQPQRDGCGEII